MNVTVQPSAVDPYASITIDEMTDVATGVFLIQNFHRRCLESQVAAFKSLAHHIRGGGLAELADFAAELNLLIEWTEKQAAKCEQVE